MALLKKGKEYISDQNWVVIALVFALFLAGLWKFTPLQEYINPTQLQQILVNVRSKWWTPLAIIGIYLATSALLVPNMLVNATTILTLGGWYGWSCAILGSLTTATVFFFIGHKLGAKKVAQIENERFQKLRRILRKGGIFTVLGVRMVPLGPYGLVNMAAGAIHIKFIEFFVGTFLAHLPGTITTAFFEGQLSDVLEDPSLQNIALLLGILVVGGIVIYSVIYYSRKKIQWEE